MALLLWASTVTATAAQQESESSKQAVYTGSGWLIVWNQPGIHFTLELNGKDVRPMDSQSTGSIAFNANGVVVQVQSVAISDFLDNADNRKSGDQSILEAHQSWEVQYIEKTVGEKVNFTSAPQRLDNGTQALLWATHPSKTGLFQEQMYLTVISGSYVVILSGIVDENATEKSVQEVLLDAMSSLKMSSGPIDVKKLQESFRSGKPTTQPHSS